jgi:hypothetical protein
MRDFHPAGDVGHYTRLETGARWLAKRSAPGPERDGHLAHAERYARLKLDAGDGERL